jgi:hypothetical protein
LSRQDAGHRGGHDEGLVDAVMAIVVVRAKSQGDEVVTSIADEFAKTAKKNEKKRENIFFFYTLRKTSYLSMHQKLRTKSSKKNSNMFRKM